MVVEKSIAGANDGVVDRIPRESDSRRKILAGRIQVERVSNADGGKGQVNLLIQRVTRIVAAKFRNLVRGDRGNTVWLVANAEVKSQL